MAEINSSKSLNTDLSLTDMLDFFKTKMLLEINTIILGSVLSVDSLNKRLTVKSLINGINSKNAPIDPPTIYEVPYACVRGGNAGIITNFVVGDNVIIGFCQRQIDITKETEKQSTPNLIRFFSLQDAVVLSHWSNSDPTIFLKITDEEITIQSLDKPININTTNTLTINASNIVINGNMTIGSTTFSSSGTSTIDGHPFSAHTHTGVTSGTSNTGPVGV